MMTSGRSGSHHYTTTTEEGVGLQRGQILGKILCENFYPHDCRDHRNGRLALDDPFSDLK